MSSLHSRKKVSYYYDPMMAQFEYSDTHVMKPIRMKLTHEKILEYGLDKEMDIYEPKPATFDEMTHFHDAEYISFLSQVNPENESENEEQNNRFRGRDKGDVPMFKGLYNFCCLSAGGSLSAARNLNLQNSDIAINWGGGLHHAFKDKAAGFCYVNDIVLAIEELLKIHPRVLYVDIDVHHGDGVQKAFLYTNRVMTVSFHHYCKGSYNKGSFFPGTGTMNEIGEKEGRGYSVNVPLKRNIDDKMYTELYHGVMTEVMQRFRPDAAVLQCGADSLAGDQLGVFNVSLLGHGECVKFLMKQNIPLMLLGGGGYTVHNVVRCWTQETALAVGADLIDDLNIATSAERNYNSPSYAEQLRETITEKLRDLEPVPSMQIQDSQTFLQQLSLTNNYVNHEETFIGRKCSKRQFFQDVVNSFCTRSKN